MVIWGKTNMGFGKNSIFIHKYKNKEIVNVINMIIVGFFLQFSCILCSHFFFFLLVPVSVKPDLSDYFNIGIFFCL